MRKTVGILAHVDAGKTTFSEQLLYELGELRAAGRVDRGDTLLDSDPLERARGITIHSGQTDFAFEGDTVYWLDTPGHPDFVREAARALPAMDAALLLLSCPDGVQPHTETLWRLLAGAGLPVFLFLNKTDLPGADRERALQAVRERLSPDAVDLSCLQANREGGGPLSPEAREEIALRDDALLERFLSGCANEDDFKSALRRLVAARRVFPVFSGAALRGDGVSSAVRALLSLLETGYAAREALPFSAVCHRVIHEDGKRYAGLKLLSGRLAPRDAIPGTEEKANAIFLRRGPRFVPIRCAAAGDLVFLPGLPAVRPGDRIGECKARAAVPAPMLSSEVHWNQAEANAETTLSRLRELEEEDPSLHVSAEGGHITLAVEGPLMLQVLEDAMKRRFSQSVSFKKPTVLCRETVLSPAVGIGHYEPLRHYAEVHLRIRPAPAGAGILFRSLCSVNDLPLHWQRLVETHIFERTWPGVLTGAPLTDLTVELLAGRAHPKHTEGGDFREATGRALRCALMNAECALLEPLIRYEIRIPVGMRGAVSASLASIRALPDAESLQGADVLLSGECRLAHFLPWQEAFPALTHGQGALSLRLARYVPCSPEEQAERVAAAGYNPRAADTPDSVFCSHGAGVVVAWNRVPDFAHVSHEGL